MTMPAVRQGPEWIARVLLAPPSWLSHGVWLLAVVALGLAALGYRREGGLSRAVQWEMATIAMYPAVIFLTTATVVVHGQYPYVVDVLLGWASGAGIVLLAGAGGRFVRRKGWVRTDKMALQAVGVLLVGLMVAGPTLLGIKRSILFEMQIRLVLAGVGGLLIVLNAQPSERVGGAQTN